MVFQEARSAFAVIAMLAFVSATLAHAAVRSKHVGAHRAHHVRVIGVGSGDGRYVGGRVRGRLTAVRQPSHFAALVGDRASGFGFYPLPWQIRMGAWRYRQRRAMQAASAIGFAIASTAVYSNAYQFGYGYAFGHHHGVFNPVDGVGSPFFAGYYGPAGDPDDDPGPFGRPYGN